MVCSLSLLKKHSVNFPQGSMRVTGLGVSPLVGQVLLLGKDPVFLITVTATEHRGPLSGCPIDIYSSLNIGHTLLLCPPACTFPRCLMQFAEDRHTKNLIGICLISGDKKSVLSLGALVIAE